MKLLALALVAVCAAAVGAASVPEGPRAAAACDPGQCTGSSCRCSLPGVTPGGLDSQNIPQVVLLTFDDAVNQLNFDKYYNDALVNRQNPNGCPISATFFVSHEYTDYSLVNQLYNRGHEIAIHSITHTTTTQYWQDATVQLLNDEFGGERQTISKFANIPAESIQGVRTPFLVLAGDNTFQSLNQNGFYDSSWPTQTYIGQGLHPYTLDYLSTQDCNVGVCPKESHPGTWVLPMVDWRTAEGVPCAMVDACNHGVQGVDPLLEFMKDNFHRHYDVHREPFGFYVHAAWFDTNSTNYEAYKLFLNYLGSKNDVYIVSGQQALKWARNPVPTSGAGETFSCPPRDPMSCSGRTCPLEKPGEGLRYMKQCTDCPSSYPWLGNPLGTDPPPTAL